MTAFSSGLSASMRRMAASTSSAGEASPARTSSACAIPSSRASSAITSSSLSSQCGADYIQPRACGHSLLCARPWLARVGGGRSRAGRRGLLGPCDQVVGGSLQEVAVERHYPVAREVGVAQPPASELLARSGDGAAEVVDREAAVGPLHEQRRGELQQLRAAHCARHAAVLVAVDAAWG